MKRVIVDSTDLLPMVKLVPGALGSLFSMIWIRDNWMKMVGMFFGGVALSYYATPYLVRLSALPDGLAGFLLGLMGMTTVASLFHGWESLNISAILNEFIRAKLRLPPFPPEPPKE